MDRTPCSISDSDALDPVDQMLAVVDERDRWDRLSRSFGSAARHPHLVSFGQMSYIGTRPSTLCYENNPMPHGQCHCGAVQFEMPDEPVASSICHCNDCRRQSGAPMLAWAMVREDAVSVTGEPTVYHSSEHGRRAFCSACGTGLFFTNAPLSQMGMIQVRIGALDDPEAIRPRMQVQTAERVDWVTTVPQLPGFARFPG